MKKRILVNKKLNKTFNVELENNCVTYQTLKNGKGRVYTKAFSCDEEALKFFSKKQWEVLKKGFVLCQKTNRFGEPKLHYYIGGGYSGALSFTHTQNAIWVYQEGSYENPDNQYDFIKSISYQGDTLEQIKTPDILAWDMQCLNNNTLLLNLDHHIYTYDIQTKKFQKLSDAGNTQHSSSSCIAVAESLIAYCNDEKLIIEENNKTLLEHNLSFDADYLDSPCCIAISKNRQLLALHSKSGVIELIDIYNKKITNITGNFKKVEKIQFAEFDQTIIVQEKYVKPLIFIEVKTGEIKDYSQLQIPEYNKGVVDFCLNDDKTKLVLTNFYSQNAYIFDFINKTYIGKIDIEYSVKTAKIQFVNNELGIRTDYGCFSLYQVE